MKKYLATAILLLTIVINSKAQVELNSGGTGAAYTLSVPGSFSLRNGIQVTFKAHANSVAAPTMNVSGTGAISIMKDGGTNALDASDIKAGQIVTLAYDGSKWQMMNPIATPPTAPTTYWNPSGSDIYNNNGGNVGIGNGGNPIFNKLLLQGNVGTSTNTGVFMDVHNTNGVSDALSGIRFKVNGLTSADERFNASIFHRWNTEHELAFAVQDNAVQNVSTADIKMTIRHSGNVGIGTGLPDRTLHVEGTGLKLSNVGQSLEMYPTGSEFLITTSQQYLSLAGNGGASAMFMDDGNIWFNLPITLQDGSQGLGRVLASDAAGNATWTDLSTLSSGATAWTRSAGIIYPTTISDKVGIGTTSPTTSLQIHSTSGSGNLRLTSASTGTTASDGFSISNDGSTNLFMTQHENANWYFATNGGTTAMTIAPSANVGIGTTNPSLFKLHVESSTNRRSGYFYNTLNATNIVNNEIMGIYAGAMGTGASDKIGGFFETSGGSGVNYGVYGQAMGGATNWAGYFAGGNVYISNNLGIGITPTQKLQVAGNVLIPAANDYMYASAKTNYSSISPVAFIPESSTYFRNSVSGYVHLSGGTYGSIGEIHAPVNLPNGATITEVRFYIADSDATYNFTYLQIFRYTMSSGASTFSSATIPTGTFALSSYTCTPNWTVDNSTYQYMIRIGMPQNTSNTKLYGVRITYTVTNAD